MGLEGLVSGHFGGWFPVVLVVGVGRFKGRLSRLFEGGEVVRGSFTSEVKMATIAVAG